MAYKTASTRETWAEIRLDYIQYNVRETKKQFDQDIHVMAMVKADGYGHGAVETAKAALAAGAEFIGVALFDEALELRDAGIAAPILVLGRTRPEDAAIAAKRHIRLTAFQKEWLLEAESHLEVGTTLSIHIKLDTGMGRFGLVEDAEIHDFMQTLKICSRLKAEGLYTHFATADEKEADYFQQQYACFLERIQLVKTHIDTFDFIHCGNSAASLRYPDQCFNMIRLGIAMYGLSPSKEVEDEFPFPLKTAFSLHSRIAQVKKVPAGTNIGYGCTYVSDTEEWIATIPIGYADGWYRWHAKNGEVLVNGRRAPIVGRICMDQVMIRLPVHAPVGTKVTLVGSQGDEVITVMEVAERLQTITYEIPCMISHRVPRLYIK
ncbi:alanine racemase [Bacillus piscicola]|uniref:alanine racemase n=1 Tax=Bacillus piscicola TaxID=1632684 RepID=UPI001F096044|nr:alanine racemase [Bacillus piscicola]